MDAGHHVGREEAAFHTPEPINKERTGRFVHAACWFERYEISFQLVVMCSLYV